MRIFSNYAVNLITNKLISKRNFFGIGKKKQFVPDCVVMQIISLKILSIAEILANATKLN